MIEKILLRPKRSWLNVNIMGLGHFTSDFYCNILPLMLPLLAQRFGLSYAECGSLFMIFQIGANFIQPPIGLIADRRNVNYLMPLSILFGAIFICSIGATTNLLLLVCFIFTAGICASGFHPIAGGIMPHVTPKNKDVLATSIFIVGGNVGFAIAPTCVAFFLTYYGSENLAWLSLPAILMTIIMYMAGLNRSTSSGKTQQVTSISEIVHNKTFVRFVMSIGFRSLVYCSLIAYLPLLLSSNGYTTKESASALLSFLVGTAFGGLVIGGLSVRLGLKNLIMITYIVITFAVGVFLYLADLSIASYIALFIAGAGLYGSTPPAIVWSQRLLTKSAAFATSMMLGFTFGLGYIVSVFTGILADFIGLHYALTLSNMIAMALAILLLIYLKEPKLKNYLEND